MNQGPRPGRILFVCTANICRSPTAELLARQLFGEDRFVYRSAGFLAPTHKCPVELVSVLAEQGINASEHRSYQLDEQSLVAADLVLTMESGHVPKATMIRSDAFHKILPLREAVAILDDQVGPTSVADLIAVANTDRDPRQYLGNQWDVQDPYGRRIKAYRKAVTEIESLVNLLLSRLEPDL